LIQRRRPTAKTNIEGTANREFFVLPKGKKLCYISSTAALGDLASHETIITEEIEWNRKNRTVIMLFLWCRNGNLARSARRLDVIIVNPGIIGPRFQEQGSGQLLGSC
jgi:hypothetical protein